MLGFYDELSAVFVELAACLVFACVAMLLFYGNRVQ